LTSFQNYGILIFARFRGFIFYANKIKVISNLNSKNNLNIVAKKVTVGGVNIMRTKITLACTECKQRNYDTMKNKKNDPDRLEMNKYCRFCRKHTLHKETK
jgi:large subunit ribosomal protein L33